MALIGYERVSTRSQNEESQTDALVAAGCERIFTDKVSGKLAARPQLDACLAYLRPGDVLVITRLARAMRSLRDLVNVTHGLKERGIGLKVLKQDIDTTNATGRFLFHILAAVDELQREIIVESTMEGLAAARTRGRKGGRPPGLTADQLRIAREMLEARAGDGKSRYTAGQVAEVLGCSRRTVYRAMGDYTPRAGEGKRCPDCGYVLGRCECATVPDPPVMEG